MDAVTLILIILVILFLFGGYGWPRGADGTAPLNGLLYLLAVVVVIILVVRLLGVIV